MRRRLIRNALRLADLAERQITAAGRPVPPREDLLTAFLPAARVVTRAARQLDAAERLRAEAEAVARASADAAYDAVQMVAGQWLEAVPAGPRWAEFDPSRFRAELVVVPAPDEGEPERAEASC